MARTPMTQGVCVTPLMLLVALSISCKKPDLVKMEQTNLRSIALDAEFFHERCKRYPYSLPELARYFSDFSSTDKWGRELQYTLAADGFTVRSAGRDAEFGTNDDIVEGSQRGTEN